MQDKKMGATTTEQIVHYANEFIDARDVHIKASPDQESDARDAKHKTERALAKAVKNARRAQ